MKLLPAHWLRETDHGKHRPSGLSGSGRGELQTGIYNLAANLQQSTPNATSEQFEVPQVRGSATCTVRDNGYYPRAWLRTRLSLQDKYRLDFVHRERSGRPRRAWIAFRSRLRGRCHLQRASLFPFDETNDWSTCHSESDTANTVELCVEGKCIRCDPTF